MCEWDVEVRDEVLVFDQGRWVKDEHLFAAIKVARLDNLVLRAGLKEEILLLRGQMLSTAPTPGVRSAPRR